MLCVAVLRLDLMGAGRAARRVRVRAATAMVGGKPGEIECQTVGMGDVVEDDFDDKKLKKLCRGSRGRAIF